ncbi:MAG: hypothetical protein HY261_02395 [Chloroflexi bacterium]|nr:hypothetical protein [Chloroflexota bacterium]
MKDRKVSRSRDQRALLLANGPFDLAHTLESGQAFRWRRHDGGYRGVVGGVVFTAWQVPSGVSFASSPRSPGEAGPLLRSHLRLDDDLPALYRRLRKDARVEVHEKEFRSLGLGYRAKYLAQLAHVIRDRSLDWVALRQSPYLEAKEALLHLPGVGEKVADCVLAFSLDQPQAFPVDVWVRRAVQEWYFDGEQVTDRQVRLWAAAHFGTDAAYAQQYLFHDRRQQGREAKSRSKVPRPH